MKTHPNDTPIGGGPVLKAAEVAGLLNVAAGTFHNRRRALEAAGFPQKLPGLNGWSRSCVMRWINSNGGRLDDASGKNFAIGQATPLELRYAAGGKQ